MWKSKINLLVCSLPPPSGTPRLNSGLKAWQVSLPAHPSTTPEVLMFVLSFEGKKCLHWLIANSHRSPGGEGIVAESSLYHQEENGSTKDLTD